MSKSFQMRTCVGCGQRAPQQSLLRVVVDAQGAVVPDPLRRRLGRGGYLHRDDACWSRFATRKGPVRSLGRAIGRVERQQLITRLRGDSEL